MDIDSFKKAVAGIAEWFIRRAEEPGLYDDAEDLVAGIYREIGSSIGADSVEDHSDLDWKETDLELYLLHNQKPVPGLRAVVSSAS
ncbi:MAG: hypothetical protein ACLU6Y_14225 [Ruminococcus sp.]